MGITPCRCLVYRDILAIYITYKSLAGSCNAVKQKTTGKNKYSGEK